MPGRSHRRPSQGHSGKPAKPNHLVYHGAVERALASGFRWLGYRVGRNPHTAIVLSLVTAIFCAQGLLFLEFEADPVKLYIPQKSELAQRRNYIENTFGLWDEPGILVLKPRGGTTSVVDKAFLLAALDVHERVQLVSVRSPHGTGEVTMRDICAQRYVAIMGEYVCAVLSALEQWGYTRDKLLHDHDVGATLLEAHEAGELDLGGLELTSTNAISARALQLKYFFNASKPAYLDGDTAAWDRGLRDLLDEVNSEPGGLVRVSYWSALFIEDEASSFVKKDSYLMALSMVFIMAYACVALGGITHDIRTSRVLLGTTVAACVALAMAAGFGLGALLGVPFQAVNPIIVFTLLGVSVDDMIIIVAAFERTPAWLPVERRLSESLAISGSTITVTSFTSATVFFTAFFVDFPALSNFCVPAGFCVMAVYMLQVTFFGACLTLDTHRRDAGRADCLPCHVPESDEAAAYCLWARPADERASKEGSLQRWMRTKYPKLLLHPMVRIFVVVGFLAPVLAAVMLIPSIKVGLPLRDTLSPDSPVLEYVDDLEAYWSGSQAQEAWLVFSETNISDVPSLREVAHATAALTSLDSVLRIHVNWLHGFREWFRCEGGEEWPPSSSAIVREYVRDEGVYTCYADDLEEAQQQRISVDEGWQADRKTGDMVGGIEVRERSRAGHTRRQLALHRSRKDHRARWRDVDPVDLGLGVDATGDAPLVSGQCISEFIRLARSPAEARDAFPQGTEVPHCRVIVGTGGSDGAEASGAGDEFPAAEKEGVYAGVDREGVRSEAPAGARDGGGGEPALDPAAAWYSAWGGHAAAPAPAPRARVFGPLLLLPRRVLAMPRRAAGRRNGSRRRVPAGGQQAGQVARTGPRAHARRARGGALRRRRAGRLRGHLLLRGPHGGLLGVQGAGSR